jgi:Flp pilus assembly protein TadG
MSAAGFRTWAGTLFRTLFRARSGATAVEFALLLPFLLTLYLGGFELTRGLSTYRKLTDTTTEIGSIVSQYPTLSAANLASIFGASTQIMQPYSAANLKIVLSEVSTDASGNPTVTWSQGYNGGAPLVVGSAVSMPPGLALPSTSYVLVQTSYIYSPTIGAAFVPSIPLSDSIYMLPRQSSSIAYTG